MKKVIYVMTSLSHKRVFESFEERSDLDQLFVGPRPIITGDYVPEDYSDFKAKKIINYNSRDEIKKIVKDFDPDIYVKSDMSPAHKIRLKDKCKIAYVTHGMAGNHVTKIAKSAGIDPCAWRGCNLYCGASKVFLDWIYFATGGKYERVVLNAFPQLDLIYNSNYYNSFRERIVKKTKNGGAKKIIMFCGFFGKDRIDYLPHNEDYIRTTIELERIARKNNWLIMVKPRQVYGEMIAFLKSHYHWSWPQKYIRKYCEIQKSPFLHFITTTGHIYRYFFVDAIVANGYSTVEFEACAIGKPLVLVKTNVDFDPFDTISSGAALHVRNIEKDLEGSLHLALENNSRREFQEKLVKSKNILLDGKMHVRAQDAIASL